MTGIMIERRYGPCNRDWLCHLERRSCAWSGSARARVFADKRTAVRALERVRKQAESWPDGHAFSFVLIHDRRDLASHIASTEVIIRTRAGSWTSFETRFKPLTRDDESLLWDWRELTQPLDVTRTWTVVDCDGRLYVSAGLHYVNRIGYLRTELPWRPGDAFRDWRYG